MSSIFPSWFCHCCFKQLEHNTVSDKSNDYCLDCEDKPEIIDKLDKLKNLNSVVINNQINGDYD